MPVLLISLICSICSFSNAQHVISNISVGNDGLFSITAHNLSNEDFKGEPSYLLEVQTSSNRVNAGENFSMRIFLSGAGDVVFGKIRVNIPTYIVKDRYVTLKDISFNFYRGSEPGQVAYNATTNTTNQEPQIDLNIPNIHFTPRDQGLCQFRGNSHERGRNTSLHDQFHYFSKRAQRRPGYIC